MTKGNKNLTLEWIPSSSIRIHPKAEQAFNIAQKFNYQADTFSIPISLFGSRSYEAMCAVEDRGKKSYLVFAGWEPIQSQFFNQQTVLPVCLVGGRISPNDIEQKAWAYLLKQISCTLSMDTFLVHAFQLASVCGCLHKITDIPERILGQPHLISEHIHRVGRKRAKRQLAKYLKKRNGFLHGGN